MEEVSKIIRIPKSSIKDDKTFYNFKNAAEDEGMTVVTYDDTLPPTISTPGPVSDVTLDDTEVEKLIESIENEGLQKIIQNKKNKNEITTQCSDQNNCDLLFKFTKEDYEELEELFKKDNNSPIGGKKKKRSKKRKSLKKKRKTKKKVVKKKKATKKKTKKGKK